MAVLFVIILAAAVPVLFTRVNPEELDIMERLAPPSTSISISQHSLTRQSTSR